MQFGLRNLSFSRLPNTAFGSILLFAMLSRWMPHPPNWTAFGAVALVLGASRSKSKLSLVALLGALFVTDLTLGFHSGMWAVYGAFALSWVLGRWMAKGSGELFGMLDLAKWSGISVLNSLVFFVLTNFAVWESGELYARTWDGLSLCFLSALPFLQGQVLGDLVSLAFVSMVLTAWAWLQESKTILGFEKRP